MIGHVKMAALSVVAVLASQGVASAQTFTTTSATCKTTTNAACSTASTGTYGNAAEFTAGSLGLQVTAWQINQSGNAISNAYLGAYSPGIGVTGINDSSGANGFHQIDNAGGYTDFVLLQFSQAVTLKSLNLASFALGSDKYTDSDLSIAAVNIPESAWNSMITPTLPTTWTNISGNATSVYSSSTEVDRTVPITGINIASKQWLVAAGINGTSDGYYDAFKIASITVSVPEPASWAMMIIGFGAVGFALRARRAAAGRGVASADVA